MPISAALAARLGPRSARRRWSPYARPHEDSGGIVEAPAPPVGHKPPEVRLLDTTQKAATAGPGRRQVVAASVAPAPPRWRLGRKMVSQKAVTPGSGPRPATGMSVSTAPGPEQKVAPRVTATISAAPAAPPDLGHDMRNQEPNPMCITTCGGDQKPPDEERRDGCGGFVFQCALEGHTEAISGISLPLGSDKLYSSSADGSVRVWDCNSGKCVDVINMGGKIGCMITHGPWVFIGVPKLVEAWNTHTGMKLSLQGPTCLVCSMTISNDILFAGLGDGCIMAWSFRPMEICVEPGAVLSRHERPVISLSVSAGRLLFSSSLDNTIKVWDLKTLQCVQTLSVHKAGVTSVLCWDQKLLSCSLDKTIKVWTISESGTLQIQHNHTEEQALLSNSSYLYYLAEGRLGLRTIFGMHRVGKTPILLCSLRNGNGIHLLDLPSFSHRGTLFCKNEVRTIELAGFGLLFTGDCAGELKIWKWAPREQEEASAVQQH